MKYKSALITSASGSIGGLTFSHNQGGNYIRSRVEPTNPQTCPQSMARASFAAASQLWSELGDSNKSGWVTYAANVPHTPPFCGPMYLTGQQQFVGSNSLRILAGQSPVLIAPTEFNSGAQQTPPESYSLGGDPLTLEVEVGVPEGSSEDGDVLLFIGPPASSGVGKRRFTFAGSTPITAAAYTQTISIADFQTAGPSQYIPWDYSNGLPFRTKTQIVYDDGRRTYPTIQLTTLATSE